MKKSFIIKSILVGSGILALGIQSANAGLVFDLRAVTGGGAIANSSKSVSVSEGVSTVTLDLWVQIIGADALATNDGLLSTLGGMIITPGVFGNVTGVTLDAAVAGNTGAGTVLGLTNTLVGNLAPLNTGQADTTKFGLVAPWDTSSTSKGGVQRQVTGDSSLDISGSTTAAGSGYINTNAGVTQNAASGLTPLTNFNLLANGVEFRVGTYTFSIAAGVSGNTTGVNYAVPNLGALNNAARASWTLDGVAGKNGVSANLSVAAPIVITVVPEPSAFGMLALGALGLVGFRRMSLRRSA